ncbi:hypothetical protein AAIA72_13045 [Hahella sp. SMD15-11]|uniref:Uncharacterized protein n=1 Tax=Thermohahella caldifontis TaxID=3142973 RepID=A0AB39UU62_9GAMM
MDWSRIETLSEWQLIEPDAPPEEYVYLGQYSLPNYWQGNFPFKFFYYDHHLVIGKKHLAEIPDFDDLSIIRKTVIHSQLEFPIQAARWFVDAIQRCFLPPDDPRAMKSGAMAFLEKVNGEWLHLTRGFHSGGHNIPGYSFANASRRSHKKSLPKKQSLEIGDPEIFGRIDGKPVISPDKFAGFMERIAERYESGEFGPPVPMKIEDSMW